MKTPFPAGTVLFVFLWLVSFALIGVLGTLIVGENSALQLVIGQVSMFLVPALLYAFYAYNDFWDDLGLKNAGKISHHSWFIFLYLLSIPLVIFLHYDIREIFTFPQSWIEADARRDAEMNALVWGFLSDGTLTNLILALLVMAALPAVCEEVFFRGVVLTNIAKRTGNIHLAVWLSAIFFSAVHIQIFGFLPIIISGVILGYSFVLTKSLWVPIIIHFLNNGIITFIYFSYLRGWTSYDPSTNNPSVSIWLVITCVVVGVLVFVNLKNASHSNSG